MTRAPAATRATEGGATLTFGLVNIPIAVYGGLDSDHGISRKQFSPAGNPIRYKRIDDATGDEVPYAEIVSKIQTEYGPVYVEDHEIETLFEISPKTLTVKAFQPQHLFYSGHYVAKKPFYVEVPKIKVGKNKVANVPAEKSLALVLAALDAKGAVAFIEFTTRGVPRPAVLTSDGILWELFHEDELREQRPLPEFEISDTQVEQFNSLVETLGLWSDEPIDTTDERSALIQAFADEKAQAGDFDKPAESEVATPVAADAGNDLLAMLAASVDAAKAKSA